MPARRYGGVGGGTTRRKHSLGNLRRAHPASGATWNVQVVRGKMSSKCLWHACRALILGLTLMLLGAGMATLGYYADHLSMGSELRGNVTVRVKNDLKGFHLNNFSYVGPIVMGFGGFIVVASCVMTFEARDSAAKVVPARLRAGGGSKTTMRSNQGSAASQRRSMGMQLQNTRWDHHFGVFRSSPADGPCLPMTSTQTHHHHHQHQQPFDRDALTAELIKFSKSLSASARFSPQLQLRRLTYTGSVPNLHSATINTTSTTTTTTKYHQSTNNHAPHPLDAYAYTTNLSHALISPYHKLLSSSSSTKRHHRHHNHHNHHNNNNYNNNQYRRQLSTKTSSSVRRVKQTNSRGVTRISNSSSLIQRTTRETNASNVGGISACTLLQPPGRVYWQASSFDESAPRVLASGGGGGGGGVSGSGGGAVSSSEKRAERNRRSDTAKRHVLARQKPIEHEEERCSPLGHRRNSTMSESSYSGRWTARCASITSRTSSIDSRRIQVDLHSPEVMPKSILRSPKRYSSGPSATPSVEREFRSQLSVCSEPPAALRHQLSGQSSLEPCVPEETTFESEVNDERAACKYDNATLSISVESNTFSQADVTELLRTSSLPQAQMPHVTTSTAPPKKPRPDTLPLAAGGTKTQTQQQQQQQLCRSNSSRTFYRPKPAIAKDRDDSIFYIKSCVTNNSCNDIYDQVQVINERRTTLLKADSEQSLGSADRKLSSFSLKMPEITERENSVDVEEPPPTVPTSGAANGDTVLEVETPVAKDEPTDVV